MCTNSSQYVKRLCNSEILKIIRNLLDTSYTAIQEAATILLGNIVKVYANPSKLCSKMDKFDSFIRTSVMSRDFISRLIRMIVIPNQAKHLLKACFWCLSQYTNEIQLSGDDCMQILSAVNIILNETVSFYFSSHPERQ